MADAKLIPYPYALIQRFIPEFEKLLYIALMNDWGEQPAAPPGRKRPKKISP